MSHKVAVVIPIHNETLNEFEKISLTQVQKVLGHYPIIFAVPEGKNFSWMPKNSQVVKFPAESFATLKAYNDLTTARIFYEKFLDYDSILIYQLDAFVFSDELEYFCSLGYDNIGAAWSTLWIRRINYRGKIYKARVGNGGFCLRNPKACCKIFDERKDLVSMLKGMPEDDFWAYIGLIEGSGFHSAPIKIADKFSFEYFPQRSIIKNGGKLPFGCHAWYKANADAYVNLFLNLGIDLRPLRGKMESRQINEVYQIFNNIAKMRLVRRINRGQSIMRYLPKKNFASIRVVRNNFSLIILARLLLENNKISDEIILYNEDEQDILIQDLKLERTPHLIITAGGIFDDALIDKITKRGINYGKYFVSFHKEYLTYCDKLFHNLGK